jgi:cytochrome c2
MKKQLFTLSAIVIAAFSLSFCSETTAKNENKSPDDTYSETIIDNSIGKELLESKCMVCHKIQDDKDAMLAPPIAHIKRKYSKVNKSEQAFNNALISFTINPKKEDAMMFGTLKQFGVMPNLNFNKEEVAKIAQYIYANDFPEPQWCD